MKKKKLDDISSIAAEAEKQASAMYDFEILLDETKSLDNKKRLLWKQIYRNAVEDRASAGTLFNNAYSTMGQAPTDHIAMGATLVKYLEKMSKSNQQLLDLSTLMMKDEENEGSIDADDIFKRIGDNDG
jgi:hypothetical protein